MSQFKRLIDLQEKEAIKNYNLALHNGTIARLVNKPKQDPYY